MARKRISRRKFVGNVGAGVAFTIVPRHVLGRGLTAPSDKLNIACIGVGGMGANDVKGVGKTERRTSTPSPSRRPITCTRWPG